MLAVLAGSCDSTSVGRIGDLPLPMESSMDPGQGPSSMKDRLFDPRKYRADFDNTPSLYAIYATCERLPSSGPASVTPYTDRGRVQG